MLTDQMTDRREKTSEKITALTDEIGTTEAHLGKLRSDLHAELGDRAASMAARAVTRPLGDFEKKLDEALARLTWIEAKLDALTEEQRAQGVRLDALEADGK